jgi:hypothetical protein
MTPAKSGWNEIIEWHCSSVPAMKNSETDKDLKELFHPKYNDVEIPYSYQGSSSLGS